MLSLVLLITRMTMSKKHIDPTMNSNRQSLNLLSHSKYFQENFNYSRRRSRAILNELSGKYFQNKRPGRQKLLERMYSNCESTTLPIYKPNQLEVSKFRLPNSGILYYWCRVPSAALSLIMERSGNAGTVSSWPPSSMSPPLCLTMQHSSSVNLKHIYNDEIS